METKRKIKREMYDTLLDQNEALGTLTPGSEDHLNACKALNQVTEAYGRLNKIDPNLLIDGAISIGMFVLYMAFSDTHIMDTRPVQFCKNFFKFKK